MVEGARLESVCTLTGYRGFESLPLRHTFGMGKVIALEGMLDSEIYSLYGELSELAEGARLLSVCLSQDGPRVRIPPSPPLKKAVFCFIVDTLGTIWEGRGGRL